MKPVVVVGAGLSGVAAARTLRAAGLEVVVLDRGHHVGGRMASRRTDDRVVDTGASYFTVSDPAFQAVVEDWHTRQLARPWTDTFQVADGGSLTPKSGPMRWAAPGGLRGLVEDLAAELNVHERTVSSVGADLRVDGEPGRGRGAGHARPAGPAAAGPGVRGGAGGARRPVRAGTRAHRSLVRSNLARAGRGLLWPTIPC